MEKVDLFAFIDEIQEALEDIPKKFGKRILSTEDYEELQEIVDDIRKAATNEFANSRNIVKERDTIIANANAQAEAIIRSANERAAEIVSENSVAKAAYEKAVKMVEQSRSKSMQIRQNAMEYATDVLEELESYFTEYLGYVRENKERLTGKPAQAPEAAAEQTEEN
ncbi:MAG: hypothetical protein J6D00_08305 [Christensenellaceae bacterium]|nr:hypothetical protein [Christensenellaceae bacterium]MBR3841646.1 hypothetical protein [Christensenellaceae bacterium]